MIKSLPIFLLIGCMISACGNNQVPQASAPDTPQTVKVPVLPQPLRYHKQIEVAPGNDFDIFSWGRGSSDTCSLLILHSDSADRKYTTTTGDLDGPIVGVYNSDMDMDGNPEILIQAKTNDTTNYTTIYAFEFTNDRAQKLYFPKLTSSQRKGYRGGDNFYIQDGALMREFPIYNGDGKNARPGGQKRLLQYGLVNNQFTVKQLSKDSSVKVTNNPAIREIPAAPKKKTAPSKKERHTAKKRHTIIEHKKKKKHHRSRD